VRRRIVTLATAAAVVLSMNLAAAPVAAVTTGPPTEIEVTPSAYNIPACRYHIGTPRAYWTVSLYGGLSGSFHVNASWGDGTPGGSWTEPDSFDTHHDFACGYGYRYQSWSASRSGGGTSYDYTQVYTY
jgi:hypothetical protein